MPPGVQGLDVSVHQATEVVKATPTTPAVYEDRVDWPGQKAKGAQFAYVKATEGDYYRSPTWQPQFNNTYNAGMIRGSYHFAIPHPDAGTAADQARYFAANGGVWSADGKTLPPLLDIEYNPYVGDYFGNTCYDRTPAQMVSWIREFSDTIYALKGRLPAIYTTTDWWERCVGNNGGFSGNPLHIASYFENPATSPGVIPNGWVGHDIWQYSSSGPFVGDSNVWRGSLSQLQSFATGVAVNTAGAIGQSWVTAGGAAGPWGRATSDERCDDSLCLQVFERRMAYWTAKRGVQSVATSGGIGSTWRSAGAAASRFGLPTGSETCTGSYCYQNFETGDLYWSAGTGVQSVYFGTDNSTIGAYWKKLGGPSSKYGLPTSGESCVGSYCAQYFERGSIYWTSATGIQPVFTAGDNSTVGGAWIKLGGVNSKFGFPTSSEQCYSGYCEQMFQKGRILWNADVGVQAVFTNGDNSTIGGLWVKAGATTSRYGFPIGPETCTAASCQQRFQFGTIVWSAAGGVQPLFYSTDNSTIAAFYTLSLGGTTGKYGFPTSADTCTADSCVQKFQFGNVYWTAATGIQPVFTNGDNSTVGGAWVKLGGVTSKYGFPTSAEKCYTNYCEQLFQRGRVLWSAAGGVQPVFTNGDNSTIGGLWVKAGAAASRYGFPIGAETCTSSSCQQRFQYGTIVWSAAGGIQPLFYSNDNSTISAYYTLKLGGTSGKFGFPISAETCGTSTCVQKFQFGNVYWSSGGGIQPVWTNGSTATIGGYYESLGGPASFLSYPAGAELCKGTICYQRFLSGYVTWSGSTGLQTVNTTKEVGKAWLGQGGVDGALGVPRDREQCSGTTSCTQNFVNGTIRWSSTSGIVITKNP